MTKSTLLEQRLARVLSSSDPMMRAGWEEFDRIMRGYDAVEIAKLDAYRKETEARAREHGGTKIFSHANFLRSISRLTMEMAFHYRVTGSAASLETVRLFASWIIAEPEWTGQRSMAGWKSDLWTADFAFALMLAFRLCGDHFSEEEKARWREALTQKAIEPLLEEWIDPKTRIHALDSMGHNWWSVCVCGAAAALFAVRDSSPAADDWLNRIADGFVEFFSYPGNVLQHKQPNFDEGAFIESISYLDYTLLHFFILLDMYEEELGRDLAAEIPVLEKIADYYLASLQPLEGKIQRLNFGDMGNGPDTMGANYHRPTPIWLWLAARYRRDDLFHLARKAYPTPTTALEFLFWPEDLRGEKFGAAPVCSIYQNTGTAILRDGYDDSCTVFAIRAGEKWNHNQSDAGSYILSSGGREFIIDTGATQYSNPLYEGYFKQSAAHNVILHDGRGQNEEMNYLGTKFPGGIAASLIAPSYRYVLADATGPWEGVYQRFYRHVLWIDDFIVMVDDMMAAYAAPWTQLFHYQGKANSVDGVTRIDHDGRVLAIHHLFPEPQDFETRTGHLSYLDENLLKLEYDVKEIPYLAVHYAGADRREKIIQVFELPGGTKKQIEKFDAEGISGIRITTAEHDWEILCNHSADGRKMHFNSLAQKGGISTDAFLVVLQRSKQGKLLSAALHNGSFLRSGEAVLFNSLLKTDAHLRYDDKSVEIHATLTNAAGVDLSPEETSSRSRYLRLKKGENHQTCVW